MHLPTPRPSIAIILVLSSAILCLELLRDQLVVPLSCCLLPLALCHVSWALSWCSLDHQETRTADLLVLWATRLVRMVGRMW